MKKSFFLLLTLTSLCYGYYRHPQCCKALAQTAVDYATSYVGDDEFAEALIFIHETIVNNLDDIMPIFDWLKDKYEEKIPIYVSKVESVMDKPIAYANDKVACLKPKMQACEADIYAGTYKLICLAYKITSVDSLRKSIFPVSEPAKAIPSPILAGDIYELEYDITCKGCCIHAHSRSLGRPHVGRCGIRYELPTGQHYSLSLKEDEGYITLRSLTKS